MFAAAPPAACKEESDAEEGELACGTLEELAAELGRTRRQMLAWHRSQRKAHLEAEAQRNKAKYVFSTFTETAIVTLVASVVASTLYYALAGALHGSDSMTSEDVVVVRAITLGTCVALCPAGCLLLDCSIRHGKRANVGGLRHAFGSLWIKVLPMVTAWAGKDMIGAVNQWPDWGYFWEDYAWLVMMCSAVTITLIMLIAQMLPCYRNAKMAQKDESTPLTLCQWLSLTPDMLALALGYAWDQVFTYWIDKLDFGGASDNNNWSTMLSFIVNVIYTILLVNILSRYLVMRHEFDARRTKEDEDEAESPDALRLSSEIELTVKEYRANFRGAIASIRSKAGFAIYDSLTALYFSVFCSCDSGSSCSYQANFGFALIVTVAAAFMVPMLEDPQTEAQLMWKQAKAQFMDVDKMKLVTRHKLALAITSMSLAAGRGKAFVPCWCDRTVQGLSDCAQATNIVEDVTDGTSFQYAKVYAILVLILLFPTALAQRRELINRMTNEELMASDKRLREKASCWTFLLAGFLCCCKRKAEEPSDLEGVHKEGHTIFFAPGAIKREGNPLTEGESSVVELSETAAECLESKTEVRDQDRTDTRNELVSKIAEKYGLTPRSHATSQVAMVGATAKSSAAQEGSDASHGPDDTQEDVEIPESWLRRAVKSEMEAGTRPRLIHDKLVNKFVDKYGQDVSPKSRRGRDKKTPASPSGDAVMV